MSKTLKIKLKPHHFGGYWLFNDWKKWCADKPTDIAYEVSRMPFDYKSIDLVVLHMQRTGVSPYDILNKAAKSQATIPAAPK